LSWHLGFGCLADLDRTGWSESGGRHAGAPLFRPLPSGAVGARERAASGTLRTDPTAEDTTAELNMTAMTRERARDA
jgi:hypothetical protein